VFQRNWLYYKRKLINHSFFHGIRVIQDHYLKKYQLNNPAYHISFRWL